MVFDPRNILVIDFGQLGDVVLSLPALSAIRERFPAAHITVAAGKSCAAVIELSGYADRTLAVDRVALRDGSKPLAVVRIARLVRNVRSAGFDFAIDLHSLSETNLLGYLSGAPTRLYAKRGGRSLDFLANFSPPPPREDLTKHVIDRYLDVLAPLGIERASAGTAVAAVPRLRTRDEDNRFVGELLHKAQRRRSSGATEQLLVGMFPGAGYPGRRWPLERFAELAERLERNDGARILLFAGPEEQALVSEMRRLFPRSAVILDRLGIPQLAAALARLAVLVSNETGPMHLATAVGAPVVVLLERLTPNSYVPRGDNRHQVIYSRAITEITTDEVYEATRVVITAERTSALFAQP